MAIAITGASRLQDLTDVNVTPAVGVDEYVLTYDHDTQKFLLRVAGGGGVTDHGLLDAASLLDDDHTLYLLATGSRTGASAAAQPFTVGISLTDTTTSTTGVIFKGADRFIHNFHHPTGNTAVPVGQNTFVGVNAGNFTMGSTATSTDHGSYNVGVGFESLLGLTTGNFNSAIGRRSGHGITTGVNNMAVGNYSLFSTSTGSGNVAVGSVSLRENLTGSNNVAIGFTSARYHANGSTPLTDAENSVYIGALCRGYNNDDSNSIVIGYAAIGLGANTTVIGSTSTIAATLYGAGLFNLTNATTNALVPMLTMTKNVTGAGTGAAGLGPVIVFQAEDSTTDSVQQARIGALWNDATHATYKADLVGYASDAAGEREIWRGRGNGSAATVGFLGAAPIARIAHVADAKTDYGAGDLDTEAEVINAINTTNGKINSILATLEGFGFHASA